MKSILANESRYLIGPAYASKYTSYEPDGYLNLGGTNERAVRLPGMTAVTVATALKLGVYDSRNLSESNATIRLMNLIKTIAARHMSNNTNTSTRWGHGWQTALWAYYDGVAAWLMWDKLSTTDRDKVVNMLVDEAKRLTTGNDVYLIGTSGNQLYETRRDGTAVTPGDSKTEENQWSAALLGLTLSMMPTHPDAAAWSTRYKQLAVSATAKPADLRGRSTVNGITLSTWLQGHNIANDGTLENHGFLHPLYMIVDQGLYEATVNGLAGTCAPNAAKHNVALMYSALVDKQFPASGGGTKTIYTPGSYEVHYPEGNDWGTEFPMYFGGFDQLVSLFGLDSTVSTPAATWEKLHNDRQIALQARHTDGRTYGSLTENNYYGREQRVGVISALTYLTTWLVNNSGGNKTCWTNS
ncbi:hypothetical protein ABGB16_23870 [Micromonospora sp. B11E3]|uniref:hypothetical protein n=1 Tax=Micromonospora sp. B11E3 TaxID=3153562 RepID=UPI00325D40FA